MIRHTQGTAQCHGDHLRAYYLIIGRWNLSLQVSLALCAYLGLAFCSITRWAATADGKVHKSITYDWPFVP